MSGCEVGAEVVVRRGEEVEALGEQRDDAVASRDLASGLSIEWTWKSAPTKPVESMTRSTWALTGVVRAGGDRDVLRVESSTRGRATRRPGSCPARAATTPESPLGPTKIDLRDAERQAVLLAVAEHAGAVVDQAGRCSACCAGPGSGRSRPPTPWPARLASLVVDGDVQRARRRQRDVLRGRGVEAATVDRVLDGRRAAALVRRAVEVGDHGVAARRQGQLSSCPSRR